MFFHTGNWLCAITKTCHWGELLPKRPKLDPSPQNLSLVPFAQLQKSLIKKQESHFSWYLIVCGLYDLFYNPYELTPTSLQWGFLAWAQPQTRFSPVWLMMRNWLKLLVLEVETGLDCGWRDVGCVWRYTVLSLCLMIVATMHIKNIFPENAAIHGERASELWYLHCSDANISQKRSIVIQ